MSLSLPLDLAHYLGDPRSSALFLGIRPGSVQGAWFSVPMVGSTDARSGLINCSSCNSDILCISILCVLCSDDNHSTVGAHSVTVETNQPKLLLLVLLQSVRSCESFTFLGYLPVHTGDATSRNTGVRWFVYMAHFPTDSCHSSSFPRPSVVSTFLWSRVNVDRKVVMFISWL